MHAKSRIAIAAIVSAGAATHTLRAAASDEASHEIERPAMIVEIDRAPLRIDTAQLRIAVNMSISAALAEAQKAAKTRGGRRIQ
jgi:hypothetical protein